MDQYLSTVIIAIITGIFSVITLIIQKKQDKVISKIDEQSMFIDREKELKRKLTQKEKERDLLIQEMMLIILDTNLYILKNTNQDDSNININEIFESSNKLRERFQRLSMEIEEISNQYAYLLNLNEELENSTDHSKK